MIISTRNGKTFSTASGETILDAALSAGIVLEYSCKTGRCGTCKTRVARGDTDPVQSETGLSEADRDGGYILSCVRTAKSDLQIDVEDLGDFQLARPKTVPCRIQSIDPLSGHVVRVTLRLPPSQPFVYLPGQYIDLIGPGGVRRSYSVANAPAGEKLIELHIRRVENGVMSRYWFDGAKVNDLVHLHGPLGTFFLRNEASRDVVFLATGTGIAPIKALLESIARGAKEHCPRSVSVFWGARLPGDHYWDPRTLDLVSRYVPVLSRADETWQGERGHVQQAVLRAGITLSEASVYACGSPEMIEGARNQLVSAGLSSRCFYADAFVASS